MAGIRYCPVRVVREIRREYLSSTATANLTGLLRAWSAGDAAAGEQLIPLVYQELRRQASRYLSRERADHTLRPTALVHEAYLRLAGQRRVVWQDRAQFFAVAATAMRRLLVDHARQHGATKRGGGSCIVSLEGGERIMASDAPDLDVIALNDALDELSAVDPLRSRMIELRFFAGLTTDETAEALGVSAATVTRGWRLARAWLHHRLTRGSAPLAGLGQHGG
jgi:RNA polymerase sigma factor (TIGR02999 family)